MVAGEHAVIASHVESGRRDQEAEAGEKVVGVHVGVGGAAAPRGLERDADAATGERGDGVMGEGRAEQIAADSLELLAVTTVGGGRGVEIHAEGGEGHRRRRRGLRAGREVRAGERELQAGGQRGVEVEVVVGAADAVGRVRGGAAFPYEHLADLGAVRRGRASARTGAVPACPRPGVDVRARPTTATRPCWFAATCRTRVVTA